jgi:hypothetical protein
MLPLKTHDEALAPLNTHKALAFVSPIARRESAMPTFATRRASRPNLPYRSPHPIRFIDKQTAPQRHGVRMSIAGTDNGSDSASAETRERGYNRRVIFDTTKRQEAAFYCAGGVPSRPAV